MENPLLFIIQKHLSELCSAIGPRPLGSASNQRAQAYIGREFELTGCQVEYQAFDCIDWTSGNITLHLGDRPIPAAIAPYSLPCALTAPYMCLGSLTELESSDLAGKIAVLHGDLTREALMPKNFPFWNPEEHRRILALLEARRPAAIVTLSFNSDQPIPVIEDGDFDIPCAVVSGKDGQVLLQESPEPLTLRMDCERRPSRGANVIARRNVRPGQPNITLTAHLDTKPGTPGALDNASGVSALLALSQALKSQVYDLGVEFVAFNGEDYFSNAGEVAYLEKYQGDFPLIRLAVNVDGVGLKDSLLGVSYLECPPETVERLETIRRQHRDVEIIAPWYQGDHALFAAAQVPTLALTSSQVFGLVDTVIHTERDDISHLNGRLILEVVNYLEHLVKAL